MSGGLGTALLALLTIVSTTSAGLETGTLRGVMSRGAWAWALAVSLALVPLGALLVLVVAALDPPIAAGLVLATAIPGGSSGPLVAALGRGAGAPADTLAAAGALFVVLALASGALVPLVAHLAGLPLDAATVALVAAAQLGPWLFGAWLRRRRPALAARLLRPLQRAGTLLLVVVVLGLLVTEGGAIAVVGLDAVVAAIVIVLLGALLLLAPGFGDRAARARASALASVALVRNLTLALLVASAAAAPPVTSLAILVFGLVMYIVTIGLALALRRGRTSPDAAA